MAWSTGNSYTTGTAITAAIMNGIGNDLRTWGGNVDGGGNNLANVAQLTATGKIGAGTASPGYTFTAAFGGNGQTTARISHTGNPGRPARVTRLPLRSAETARRQRGFLIPATEAVQALPCKC